MPSILVLHGPNLNLLGRREPEVYGRTTLAQIDEGLRELGRELGVEVRSFQSNHEGALVDRIQESLGESDAVLINPAAYTHTSVAIRDALAAGDWLVIEIHLSNVYVREAFRHHSFVSGVATAVISGLGAEGYRLGLRALAARITR